MAVQAQSQLRPPMTIRQSLANILIAKLSFRQRKRKRFHVQGSGRQDISPMVQCDIIGIGVAMTLQVTFFLQQRNQVLHDSATKNIRFRSNICDMSAAHESRLFSSNVLTC